MQQEVTLSIVIKALNEAHNIGRTLDSIEQIAFPVPYEVIVADSISTDGTVEISLSKGAQVVQLESPADRSCGIGPQLGFQYARGEFILLIDGDMELVPGFVEAALAVFEASPDVAGVGGRIQEMNLDSAVFSGRMQRNRNLTQVGDVGHLDMGGMYRRRALEEVGYFSNRNLHSYEELELGCRLVASGWRLVRIDATSVRHHGHELPRYQLLMRRWRSRYALGPGEFLKASVAKPWFRKGLREFRAYLVTVAGWLTLLLGIVCLPWAWWPMAVALLIQVALMLVLVVKRGGPADGLFAFASWNVLAAGTVLGFVRPQVDPKLPIQSRRVHAT